MTANFGRQIRCLSLCAPLSVLLFACCVQAQAADGAAPAGQNQEELTFEKQIRPVLKAYCLDCHGGGDKLEANLDLRLKRFALKGGDMGTALIPGDAAGSLMLQRMKSGEMPPTEKKVPADKIAIVEQWIATGAKTARDEPESLPAGTIGISADDRAYWFFQPLETPAVPVVSNTVTDETLRAQQPTSDLIRTPIDAFVLAKLREKGLRYAPDADRLTYIRRAALDLTGLPPSLAEIEQFLADTSPNAYEALLDRMLATPQYGERWGRHWLDVAGYAESEGNGSEDTPRNYAYKYRDYVIRSFNADKPFDQFLIEQIAGDELVPQPWTNLAPDQIDKLAATGFLKMAVDATATGGVDEAFASNQVVADTIKIVSSSLLGLSVGCAQCHDHRYDPISQADYFRLRAVFEPALDPNHWRRPGQRLISLYTDADRAKAAEVAVEAGKLQEAYNVKQAKFMAAAFDVELAKFPADQQPLLRAAYEAPADKRTEEQKKLLDANPKINISPGVLYQYNMAAADELKKDAAVIAAKHAERPFEDYVSVLSELPGVIPETKIFYRGDHRDPRKPVLPGDLTIAAPEGQRFEIPADDPALPTSGRRLAFSKHLVNGKHPLLGRVMANRLWLHHFGRGIVDTPGEFGILGVRPTHPELLDWLATELVRQGWSLKKMHKQIMLSSVYRQSSVWHTPDAQTVAGATGMVEPRKVDTDNSYYWHFPIRRLEAEALRDRMLATSGRLDRTAFGPSVAIEEDFVGQVVAKVEVPRRSVYVQVRRSKPVSFLSTFDLPVMMVNCERRVLSTGAPQSLMLMNSDFVLKEAGHFAARVRKETPADYLKELSAPLAAKYASPQRAWQYGYGRYDEATKKVATFTTLPHYTGDAWQGGPTLPDPNTTWAMLRAAGGHAGSTSEQAAIRRWTAPRSGTLAIVGQLKHGSESGNGVRGRVVSSRSGLASEWAVKNSGSSTEVPALVVVAGDTVDFVLDAVNDDPNADSFEWIVQLSLAPIAGATVNVGEVSQWDSSADFHGPLPEVTLAQQVAFAWPIAYQRPITPEELELACQFLGHQLAGLKAAGDKSDHELSVLTNLCQQLLSSNEFLHVD